MAGIEKMTEAIIADAKQEADSIISKAQSAANDEKDKAFEEISKESGRMSENLDRELEDFRARAESARDLARRRMILEKKQEIIARMVEKIRLSLHDAESDNYFSQIYKMFEKYCRPEEGTMHLNSKDLGRVPSDFSTRIESIAKSKGGSVKIAQQPAPIEDGFVLVYGGTEENCTFRSLIESEKESLYDEINRMLWRDANV